MVKITMQIDGMACGMCEAHINEAVRAAFPVKKVRSSYRRGLTEIVAETPIDEFELRAAVEKTGYRVTDVHIEPYVKKGLFGKAQ